VLLALLFAWPETRAEQGAPAGYFRIRVVDEQSGRGVPLVELKTTNNIRSYTDSNGLLAFSEPGLMNQKVFFFVSSHGYEYPKDGFGFAGVALDVKPGGRAEIRLRRVNIAERLYRVTGQGIYHDSLLLGDSVPIAEPVLNAQVMGQDSVQAAVYRGNIHWFWGDTARPSYPLGQFRVSGAASKLPADGGLDPSAGVDLQYFVGADGFSKQMCPMPEAKEGAVWLDGVMVVPDEAGRERLVAHYARMKSLGEMLEHGFVIYDDESETFGKVVAFDLGKQWQCLQGHPTSVTEGGTEYRLFPRPYPVVRVRADLAHVKDQGSYEAFTPLLPGSSYRGKDSKIERDSEGRAVWGWKADTDPIGQSDEKQLIDASLLAPQEARFQLKDVDTQQAVLLHSGTFFYNAFRRKWILIGVQVFGSSFLGEVWFAEADSPTGPWAWAKKIVTHDRYSFYNPAHHPFFDQEGGRIIYFEGTYASTFSGNTDPTPRYDYNQVMYRLDLSDPRLDLSLLRSKGSRVAR
jgi:hypothetical protein